MFCLYANVKLKAKSWNHLPEFFQLKLAANDFTVFWDYRDFHNTVSFRLIIATDRELIYCDGYYSNAGKWIWKEHQFHSVQYIKPHLALEDIAYISWLYGLLLWCFFYVNMIDWFVSHIRVKKNIIFIFKSLRKGDIWYVCWRWASLPPGHLHQAVYKKSPEDHQWLQSPVPQTALSAALRRRLCSIRSRTSRLRDSFFPQAIRLMNSQN